MSIRKILTAALFSMTVFSNSCSGQSASEKTIQEVQQSHIKENVPKTTSFDTYLKSDLEKYFSKKHGKVVVIWEFLREGATQSGVAYPKYYLWTKVYMDDKLITEGAARVAAIDRREFDVTDFVSIEGIKKDTPGIYQIFPATVCETIKLRL